MSEKTLNPTPWVINTEHPGSREAVKAAVAAAKQKPEGSDQSLIEVGKEAICKLVDLLPGDVSHAVVRADGRITPTGIRLIINVDNAKIL